MQSDDIQIRMMRKPDAQLIYKEQLAQGWHPELTVFQQYYQQQQIGARFVFVAECAGELAGYVTLLPHAAHGPFARTKHPYVNDFCVFSRFQRRGIGSCLMDALEKKAVSLSDTVTLAVGLHSGYGSAQQLYIKRGYVPDGSGVWYRDEPLTPYANCCNDDDLVLYLYKQLQPETQV